MSFNRLHLIRQVDLFTLRLFLSAVEEQQISRAAIRENIAVSTATKRIQDLEQIVGVKLLVRSARGVLPSPAGEVLVRYIRSILSNLDDMRSEIAALAEGIRGEITVASARSIIAPLLARELGEYSRDYPLVGLVVNELENAEIVRAVSHGEADVGVFAMAPELDLSGLDTVLYRKDRIVAVVPRGHPLAERPTISFEELLPHDLIVVCSMLSALDAQARQIGRELKPKLEVRSAGVAISLAQAGLGVTIQPECLLGVELFDQIAAVNLIEPWATRSLHIATVRAQQLSPATSTLVSQLMAPAGSLQDQQAPAAPGRT